MLIFPTPSPSPDIFFLFVLLSLCLSPLEWKIPEDKPNPPLLATPYLQGLECRQYTPKTLLMNGQLEKLKTIPSRPKKKKKKGKQEQTRHTRVMRLLPTPTQTGTFLVSFCLRFRLPAPTQPSLPPELHMDPPTLGSLPQNHPRAPPSNKSSPHLSGTRYVPHAT